MIFGIMKILLLFALCAVVAAAPKNHDENQDLVVIDSYADIPPENRNILVNALIRQLISFVRGIIQNGSRLFGIPPLDPLNLDHFHLVLPAGLINLDLELKNIFASGLGGFIVHKSNLQLSDLSFDIDIEVPLLDISTELYDLTGDLLTAIPLYGNGKARFIVEQFRLRAKLYLKQSDDGTSVILDRVEDASFDLPSLKSKIDGAIGGGDIDGIVNAIIEDVMVGYINRFRGGIAKLASEAIVSIGNPILEQLDTWRFIAPLLPK